MALLSIVLLLVLVVVLAATSEWGRRRLRGFRTRRPRRDP
jgi:hypothetical protein